MKENLPIRDIPLPDYKKYRLDLCHNHNLSVPLNVIPFNNKGNLSKIPVPINSKKTGWPWDTESTIKFADEKKVPKVSVVVPSFQQGSFIEETIRSVLLQNYPNLELIIIDGGSTDDTVAILEYYKGFISCYISEADRGQAHAINKGFSLADGDLYYWLNSDDFVNINSINKVVPHFINNPRLDIIYGDGYVYNDQRQELNYAIAPWVKERYLRFGSIVLSHSVIWRKKAHCPLWEDLNCAMDAELWLRLFNNRYANHCHFPIGTLRIHPDQKTSKMDVWSKKWNEDYEKYIWRWYPSISPLYWKWRVFEYYIVQKLYQFLTAEKKLMRRKFNNTRL